MQLTPERSPVTPGSVIPCIMKPKSLTCIISGPLKNPGSSATSFIKRKVCVAAIFLSFLLPLSLQAQTDTAYFSFYGGIHSESGYGLVQNSDSGFTLAGTTNSFGAGSNSMYLVRTDKTGNRIWSSVFGSNQPDQGYAIDHAPDASYIVCGIAGNGPNGGYDGVILSVDSNGALNWQKYEGGSDWDFLYSVRTLPDSTFVLAGQSYSNSNGGADAWAMRMDRNGDVLWNRHFGLATDEVFYDVCYLNGELIFCGSGTSTNDSTRDAYLVKTDLDGIVIGETRMDYGGDDEIYHITPYPPAGLVFCGGTIPSDSTNREFILELRDTSYNLVWRLPADPNISVPTDDYMTDALVRSSGEIVALGQKDPSGFGKKSIFALRVDGAGNYIASHTFGGAEDDIGNRIIHTFSGGMAICGESNSFGTRGFDMVLLRLTSDSLVDNYSYDELFVPETLSPIGVEEIVLGNTLTPYPDPCREIVHFDLSDVQGEISLEFFDVTGKQLLKFAPVSGTVISISVNNLKNGIYFYNIFWNSGQKSGKILVNR